jgi:hypothetical protein
VRIISAVVTLVVAATLATLATTPPAAAADDPAVVTWPTATMFTPATPYVFQVSDVGPGALSARFASSTTWTPVPRDGEVSLTVDVAGRHRVQVQRCTETCAVIAESPSFRVYTEARVSRVSVPAALGRTPKPLRAQWLMEPFVGSTATAVWTLAAGSRVVASGTESIPATGYFTLAVPPTLPTRRDYVLSLDFTVHHPTLGDLPGGESSDYVDWFVDTRGSFDPHPATIYPLQEQEVTGHTSRGTLFEGDVEVTTNARAVDVDVLDLQGRVLETTVHALNRDRDGRVPVTWNGRVHDEVRRGDFVVRARWTDSLGNTGEAHQRVRVSDLRTEWRTFRRTVTPEASLVDRLVGRCADLTRPGSRKGWRGSLGYVSRDGCADPAQSVVATVHGMRVPRSQVMIRGEIRDIRYQSELRFAVYGGAALGGPRTSGLAARIVRPNGTGRFYRMDERIGWHRFNVMNPKGLVHRRSPSAAPVLYWEVGLGSGLRYDVRSFRVEFEYGRVLGRP